MMFNVGGNEMVTLKWKKDFLPEICTTLVEIYDPSTNSWSLGPDLANALCVAGWSVMSFASQPLHSAADSVVNIASFSLHGFFRHENIIFF